MAWSWLGLFQVQSFTKDNFVMCDPKSKSDINIVISIVFAHPNVNRN